MAFRARRCCPRVGFMAGVKDATWRLEERMAAGIWAARGSTRGSDLGPLGLGRLGLLLGASGLLLMDFDRLFHKYHFLIKAFFSYFCLMFKIPTLYLQK